MAVTPIQVQKYLGRIDDPANKEDAVKHAEGRGADDDVIERLRSLPMDRFNSPKDISAGIGTLNH